MQLLEGSKLPGLEALLRCLSAPPTSPPTGRCTRPSPRRREFIDALLPRIAGDPERRRHLPSLHGPGRDGRALARQRGAGRRPEHARAGLRAPSPARSQRRCWCELDVDAVILGHSERRQFFCETDEALARKLPAALAAGLEPILCVGESEEARDGGADRGGAGAPAAGRSGGARSEPIWLVSSSPTSRSGRSAPAAPRPRSRPRRRSPSSATCSRARGAAAERDPDPLRRLGEAGKRRRAAGATRYRRRPGRRRQPRPS